MDGSRAWGGVILIALGLLFLLSSMDIMDVGEIIRIGWPVILIALGLKVIFSRPRVREAAMPVPGVPTAPALLTSADTIDQSAVFGSLDIAVSSQAFAGGAASTVFGEVTIDLTAAALSEGQVLLRLSGVFGAVQVRLPRGTEYAVSLSAVLGSVSADARHQDGFSPSLRFQTPAYSEAPRRLMITASVVFGEVTVRSM